MKVLKEFKKKLFKACKDALSRYRVEFQGLTDKDIDFICYKASNHPLHYQSIIADEFQKRGIDPTRSIGATLETLAELGWIGEGYSVRKAVETVRGEIPLEEGFMEFDPYDMGLNIVLDGTYIKKLMEEYEIKEEEWEELEHLIEDLAYRGEIPDEAIVQVYVMDREDAEDLLKAGIPVIEGAFSGYTIDPRYWRKAFEILWRKMW